jgi:hypothetical protein
MLALLAAAALSAAPGRALPFEVETTTLKNGLTAVRRHIAVQALNFVYVTKEADGLAAALYGGAA